MRCASGETHILGDGHASPPTSPVFGDGMRDTYCRLTSESLTTRTTPDHLSIQIPVVTQTLHGCPVNSWRSSLAPLILTNEASALYAASQDAVLFGHVDKGMPSQGGRAIAEATNGAAEAKPDRL